RRLDEQLEKAVVRPALDEDPRARATVLTRVVEDGGRRRRGRPLQVGVAEDDGRRLAAELDRAALDRPPRPPLHLLTDLGGAGEPVKPTCATSGCPISRLPATEPFPGSTLTTPSGIPASSASSPSRSAESGVTSAGLRTTVLPQASAGPSFQLAMLSGKFQ